MGDKDRCALNCVAIPSDDYRLLMDALASSEEATVVDREGNSDKVQLVDGVPVEVSTGRRILCLGHMTGMGQLSAKDLQEQLMRDSGGKKKSLGSLTLYEVPKGVAIYSGNPDTIEFIPNARLTDFDD